MSRFTTYLTFQDDQSAIAALVAYRTDTGWSPANVDAGFPIFDANSNPVAGYFVNVLSTARIPELEALPAWTGTAQEDVTIADKTLRWVLVAGSEPVTAARVFA